MSFVLKGDPYVPGLEDYMPPHMRQQTVSGPADEYIPEPPTRHYERADEIAELMRSLTYSEMMELGAGIWNAATKSAGCSEINMFNFPQVLILWANNRQKGE